MAYTPQNFTVGQKLTAEALNKMDKQIERNAAGVDAFNRQMVIDELETLSLETDGQYIILKLGDVVIAEVAIADVTDVIACTDLAVTSVAEIVLDAGETSTITCKVQPSDCNQVVRFRSEDLSVASVASTGEVTGIGAGICAINVLCGSHAGSVQAKVSKIVRPTWLTGNCIYVDSTDKNGSPASKLEQTSSSKACVFPQQGTENIFLKAGQKVTVTYNGTGSYYFQYAFAIAPQTEDGFAYTGDWNDRLCAANCKTVAAIVGGNDTLEAPIEYTATEDCYIVFTFSSDDRTGEEYTQEQLDALNTGLVTVRVSPT